MRNTLGVAIWIALSTAWSVFSAMAFYLLPATIAFTFLASWEFKSRFFLKLNYCEFLWIAFLIAGMLYLNHWMDSTQHHFGGIHYFSFVLHLTLCACIHWYPNAKENETKPQVTDKENR